MADKTGAVTLRSIEVKLVTTDDGMRGVNVRIYRTRHS
jgi:hypothetical protein